MSTRVAELHAAIKRGDKSFVLDMIQHDVTLSNAIGDRGRTSLHIAVENDLEILKTLLALGADPNAVDAKGTTPLAHAVQLSRYREARALLDAGADPRISDRVGHDALWHSVRRELSFPVPFSNGRHVTLFIPPIFPSRIGRLIRKELRWRSAARDSH